MNVEVTGWPDPSRGGVPLNPEKDGWHWVVPASSDDPIALRWCAQLQFWLMRPHRLEESHYLGPCLTPAEMEEQLAAARREGAEAMREAIIRCIQTRSPLATAIDRERTIADIRALPVEGGGDAV